MLRDASGTRVKGSEILIRKAIAAYIEENEFENTVHMQNFNKERVDNVYLVNLYNTVLQLNIHIGFPENSTAYPKNKCLFRKGHLFFG